MARMLSTTYIIHLMRYVICICILIGYTSGSGEPIFHLPVMNVTYVAGTTAILPCSVEHLGEYAIVWANPKAITVTLKDRRITDDNRISVERPTTTSWNLHIRDVEPSDGGIYSCHINTSPVKVKRIDLIVQVPPKIIDHLSSIDTSVREGETVSLVCNVTGIPQPTVTWYRQKRHEGGVKEPCWYGSPSAVMAPSSYNRVQFLRSSTTFSQLTEVGPPGEVLIIHNVTRYCDDIYTCEASNGVPPNSYRKMAVKVLFLPDVRLPIKRMGQLRGKETILDCTITAVPLGGMAWERNGRVLKKSRKYRIEPYDESGNSYTLSIRILDLDESDFGEYTCVASNVLGKDQESMILYDATEERKTTTSLRPEYERIKDKEKNHERKKERPDVKPTYVQPDTEAPYRQYPNKGYPKNGECRLEWNGRLLLSLLSLFIAMHCLFLE